MWGWVYAALGWSALAVGFFQENPRLGILGLIGVVVSGVIFSLDERTKRLDALAERLDALTERVDALTEIDRYRTSNWRIDLKQGGE